MKPKREKKGENQSVEDIKWLRAEEWTHPSFQQKKKQKKVEVDFQGRYRKMNNYTLVVFTFPNEV